MSIEEIDRALRALSPGVIAELTDWFAEFPADTWNIQIAKDSSTGKLDGLISQAHRDFDAGRCKPLSAMAFNHFTTPDFWADKNDSRLVDNPRHQSLFV